ncbi:MAG: Sodium-dependent transporter, partial [uncultured Blastococcus sp.]
DRDGAGTRAAAAGRADRRRRRLPGQRDLSQPGGADAQPGGGAVREGPPHRRAFPRPGGDDRLRAAAHRPAARPAPARGDPARRHRPVDHRAGAHPGRRAHRHRRDRRPGRGAGRRRPGAVRVDDGLHLHRRLHPRHGDAQARAGPAVRDVRAVAEVGRHLDLPGGHRLRGDHGAALGVRLQHRHRRHAAADGARDHRRHRQAPAGQGAGEARLRPAAPAGRRRRDADARLRRERRRSADPCRHPAEPDRPRPHRGGDGGTDRLPGLDAHGHADLRADVRRAGRRAAAAQQAGDPPDRGRQRVRAEGAGRAGEVLPGREEHADRLLHHRRLLDLPGHHRPHRRHRLRPVRDHQRPDGRGRHRRARRLAAVPAADGLEVPRVHAQLERRGEDRLGHDPAVRHRHHLRLAAGQHRSGRDHRRGVGGLPGPDQHVRDHDLRGDPGDHHQRDDQQHRVGRRRGADHHPGGDGGGGQPVRAGARGHVRRVLRFHAAGVDAAERDRLRLGRRADHQDDPVGGHLRRPGRPADRGAAAGDGRPGPGLRRRL